jgi:hypothetical protein
MASYKSGFDPPTRPAETSRGRRLGQYMTPGQAKQEHREADIAHISGQMEGRRVYPPLNRQLQTGLPKPNLRDPSPNPRPEVQKPGTGSRFGFGRVATKAVKADPPELRGKSSRNVLRRKPSSIAQNSEIPRPPMDRSISSSPTKWTPSHADKRPSIDASLRAAEAYNEIFTKSKARALPANETPRIIPELDRYRSVPDQNYRTAAELPHKLSTQDLPPPTPLLSGTPIYSGSSSHHRYSGYSGSGYSGSPSTRFSESPGPGAYSRDTTPTSMSSMSPGIIAPLKTPSRVRQGSPAVNRPPVTMRGRSGSNANEPEALVAEPQGLTPLRESLTSSSSNSTVKGDKGDGNAKEKKKKKRLSPLPPSPPPRKSSQKFKKSRPEEQESPCKPSQAPAESIMTSLELSSPAKPRTAPSHIRQKSNPPVRPSREGAPDLQSQLPHNMTPIIQSNLAGIGFIDRRRSALPRITAGSPLHTQLPSPAFRRPSNGSPSPVMTSPREGTPAPAGLGLIPDLRPPIKLTSSTGTRTPSPSVANSRPRFGLFGRRAKTAPEVPTVEKTARKGPAAGTGHEGYGKYAARGRSSSAGGLGRGRDRSMSAASSSQESVASTRTHDPFLLQRMSPVIIAGGGDIIENRNTSSELSRTESNTSISLVGTSHPSSNKSSLSHEVARTTLWPSALPRDPVKRQSAFALPKGRRPSDSSDDGIGKNSLAFRRSMQRLNNSASALHLPRPLNISKITGPGSMTSLDASIMSDESQLDMQVEVGRGRKGVITKPKKLEKRTKSPRKWNFFHRSQPKTEAPSALQVTVGKPAAKSIPHYAMMDSSDEQQDPLGIPDLEDILRDADVISLSNEELDLLQFGETREEINTMPEEEVLPEEKPPAIFTSPEPMTPEPLKTDLHLVKETAPTRPSRLPQVGRIPKVISARPVATSPKSFSRPFARLSTIQPIQVPLQSIDKSSVALGPSPEKPSTPEPFPVVRKDDRQSSADSKTDSTAASHKDFLAFSPRKNSEATTSSSGGLSFAGTTAVIPEPNAALEEDEVWDEYDDLIENPNTGDNDDTIKVPTSATSSHGGPFQYESYESRRVRKSKIQPPKESPTVTQFPLVKEPTIERQSAMSTSSTYSADMNARMKDLLTTIPTPTTPMSFTDFFSGYGDRNNSTPGSSARKPHQRTSNSNSPKPHRDSNGSNKSSHARSLSANAMLSIPEQERERREESPISQVNLRVGSMTVSKWLTFGHVLFSPAREDIIASSPSSSKTHSILVIDGLGNGKLAIHPFQKQANTE